MATAHSTSLAELFLRLVLGSVDVETSNRICVDGITVKPAPEGGLEIGVRRLEATSFQVTAGPVQARVGRLAVNGIIARVGMGPGKPQLLALQAADAELAGVEIGGPVDPAHAAHASAVPWSLAPLAGADGTIRAEIVDAHLVFDAQVKVPIRAGGINFGDATVEHVGPDSRMGVSRMGIYVDAPNGRSYLFQFSSPPVAGVEYERRGAMLGPWVTDRGRLQLQAFGEWLLRQPVTGKGMGFTDQARLLFERTAISGDVQLGDGVVAVAGVQGELAGRAEGHNAVRLQSRAVGRGVTAEMPSLSVRDAAIGAGASRLHCARVTGALTLRLSLEGGQLRFLFSLGDTKLSTLRLDPHRTPAA